MDAKLKRKWLRALRGGQYRSGRGLLVNTEGTQFCCLGVLADIQGCTWKMGHDEDGLVPVSKSGRQLVRDSTDILKPRQAGGLSAEHQNALAHMNDDGKSFKQIADHIEQNYDPQHSPAPLPDLGPVRS